MKLPATNSSQASGGVSVTKEAQSVVADRSERVQFVAIEPTTASELAALFAEIDAWHDIVAKALQAMILREDFHAMIVCPVCRKRTLDVCVRADRLTFSGREPACVQYICDECGQGGEYERGQPL